MSGKQLKISIALLLLLLLVLVSYFMNPMQNFGFFAKHLASLNSKSLTSIAFNGDQIVHLDLKGAPPKISYYKKLFPLLALLGATGLLLEYEDMFPYKGRLENVSAHNAYNLEDIKIINRLALKSNLIIIPLVPTFGHMEFILKLKEFSHLREMPDNPQVICPTHEETLLIIVDMLDQIIAAHPHSNFIHIGADEVYCIGQCNGCISRMNQFTWSQNQLFLEHVRNVAEKVKNKHEKMRVLMWDDQLRSMPVEELKKSRIADLIEPVVWKYTKNVHESLGRTLWEMYAQIFPNVWVASAFKGAMGSREYLTDAALYVQNQQSWLSVMSEYRHHFNFQGVLLTGWQRYDHFAVLCELLPVAIPSLAMSLRALSGTNDSPFSAPTEIAGILQCEQPYALIGRSFGSPKCSYSGGDVLEAVVRLYQLQQEYDLILEDSRVKGWISDYSIAHFFSNPQYVLAALAPIDRIREELIHVEEDMATALMEVYDNYTVSEWIETYIKPFKTKIVYYYEAKQKLISRDSWPRRPLADF